MVDVYNCLREWHDHEAELQVADTEECVVKVTCNDCEKTGRITYTNIMR